MDVIEECVEKGLMERQRTIGFSASAACADMLEILLHKHSLIDPGFTIKHEWLKSKNKIKEKFPFDFPSKNELLNLIFKIEEKRDILCYGKPQKACRPGAGYRQIYRRLPASHGYAGSYSSRNQESLENG